MSGRMRKVRSMQTATPEQTARSMQLVESNASDAFDSMDDDMMHTFRPVTVSDGASLSPQVYDFVQASGSSYVYLPEPTPEMAGKQIAVVSRDGSPTSVLPLGGTIRLTTSVTVSATAPVYFICDGRDWW